MSTILFISIYHLEPSVQKPFIKYPLASWLGRYADNDVGIDGSMIDCLTMGVQMSYL